MLKLYCFHCKKEERERRLLERIQQLGDLCESKTLMAIIFLSRGLYSGRSSFCYSLSLSQEHSVLSLSTNLKASSIDREKEKIQKETKVVRERDPSSQGIGTSLLVLAFTIQQTLSLSFYAPDCVLIVTVMIYASHLNSPCRNGG